MLYKLWGKAGDRSPSSFLSNIPLGPHVSSSNLEYLLSICFMLDSSIYSVSYNLPSSASYSIDYIFITLQVKKMRLSLDD